MSGTEVPVAQPKSPTRSPPPRRSSKSEKARLYLEHRNVAALMEEITQALVEEQPSDPKAFIAKFCQSCEATSKPHAVVAALKQSVQLSPEREPFTSNLSKFDDFVAIANTDRTLSTAATNFWTTMRNKLFPFTTGVGWKMECFDDTTPLDTELIKAAVARVFAVLPIIELNPVDIAMELGAPEEEILTEFFEGTKAGVFAMRWGPRCKRCFATTTSNIRHIAHVPTSNVRCSACRFENNFSLWSEVKVSFFFNQEILYVPCRNPPCHISPEATAAMVQIVPAFPTSTGHGYRFPLNLKKGSYRMFCGSSGINARVDVENEHVVSDDGSSSSEPIHLSVRSTEYANKVTKPILLEHGNVDLELRPDDEAFVALAFWPFDLDDDSSFKNANPTRWATAADCLCHPTFHNYFGDQVVTAEQNLSIENVVIAFTDIVNSTAHYARLGDGHALQLVQSHFDILFDAVRMHSGRVIKTIGDAVHATFLDCGKAIEAFVEAINRIDKFNKDNNYADEATKLQIRVGLHCGTVTIVALNGVNDCFGQYVNAAARIEGKCTPNHLLATTNVMMQTSAQKAVAKLIEEKRITVCEVEPMELKGVKEKIAGTLITVLSDCLPKNM